MGYYHGMRFLSFMNTPFGRSLRVAGGVALIGVGTRVGGSAGTALAAFAVLPIATGVLGACPVNPLFGRPMRACALPADSSSGL